MNSLFSGFMRKKLISRMKALGRRRTSLRSNRYNIEDQITLNEQ